MTTQSCKISCLLKNLRVVENGPLTSVTSSRKWTALGQVQKTIKKQFL